MPSVPGSWLQLACRGRLPRPLRVQRKTMVALPSRASPPSTAGPARSPKRGRLPAAAVPQQSPSPGASAGWTLFLRGQGCRAGHRELAAVIAGREGRGGSPRTSDARSGNPRAGAAIAGRLAQLGGWSGPLSVMSRINTWPLVAASLVAVCAGLRGAGTASYGAAPVIGCGVGRGHRGKGRRSCRRGPASGWTCRPGYSGVGPGLWHRLPARPAAADPGANGLRGNPAGHRGSGAHQRLGGRLRSAGIPSCRAVWPRRHPTAVQLPPRRRSDAHRRGARPGAAAAGRGSLLRDQQGDLRRA
jgi:hypothetical protein